MIKPVIVSVKDELIADCKCGGPVRRAPEQQLPARARWQVVQCESCGETFSMPRDAVYTPSSAGAPEEPMF